MTWEPLWLSYKVAAAATVMTLVVGVGLAALLARPRLPGRNLVDAIVTVPMILPPTVLGYYLLTAFGRHSAVGRLFQDVTGRPLLFSVTGCIIAGFVGSLPLVVKSARSALEGVDPTLIQAARTLGASRSRAFLTVTLPLAAPGITAGLMLGFARALGDFGMTMMVAGDIPGETQTASLYIYDQIMANQESRALGMIAVLTATAVATLWAVNTLGRKHDHH
jgi:molybdate transport system permease protein